jgi:hypothetical protein
MKEDIDHKKLKKAIHFWLDINGDVVKVDDHCKHKFKAFPVFLRREVCILSGREDLHHVFNNPRSIQDILLNAQPTGELFRELSGAREYIR